MPEPVQLRGQPHAPTVALLEELLAQARAGDVTDFAYALVRRGRVAGQGWERAPETDGNTLMAAIAYLHHRFAENMTAGDQTDHAFDPI